MIIDDLIEITEKERAAAKPYTVRCCMAAGCMSSNSKAVKEALVKSVNEAGLTNEVEVRGCANSFPPSRLKLSPMLAIRVRCLLSLAICSTSCLTPG